MKGYIYSIRSHQTKDIYIGSTEQQLCNRMSGHRRDYKNWLNEKFHYITSFEILKYEDAYIELIIEVEVQSKQELKMIEGKHQRTTDCVNKLIAGQTLQEWREANHNKIKEQTKKYRKENREQMLEYQIHYRENNLEQINDKAKEKITCKCGFICRKSNISYHLKSNKHIKYLEDNKKEIL